VRTIVCRLEQREPFLPLNLCYLFQISLKVFAFPSLSSCYAIPLATTVPWGIKASKKLSIIEIARVILLATRKGLWLAYGVVSDRRHSSFSNVYD
jgi:hypothetical protein